MVGPCAKAKVACVIVTPNGERFEGRNDCIYPQEVCPRAPGEGYEKCRSVCMQPGHAEIMALMAAGEEAKGAHAYVYGRSYSCRSCQEALYAAGVKSISVVTGVVP